MISTLSGRALLGLGAFTLPVSEHARTINALPPSRSRVLSPYFQPAETRKVGTGRDIQLIPTNMIKATITGYQPAGSTQAVGFQLEDSNGIWVGANAAPLTIGLSDTPITIDAGIEAAIQAYMASNGGPSVDVFQWLTWRPRAFSTPSLAVNTARQASAERDALVVASVEIDATLSLSGGSKGSVTLQYADDSAFTTNVVAPGIGMNGNTGTLTLGLNTVGAGSGNVVGIVPAGKYYRLHTTNITGTPTYGTPTVQEVLL